MNSSSLLKNKYVRVFYTIFAGGAAYGVSYLLSLVLTPFITDRFGTEVYGYVSLGRQFTQYATILTVALSSFASRHIAVGYYQNDLKKANTYYNSAFYGELTLSTVILIFAVCVISFMEKILKVPFGMETDIKLLFIFIFFSFWISSAFNVFQSWAYIKNRLDLTNIFKGIGYISEAVILYLCYRFLSGRIFYVGLSLSVASAVIAVSNYYYAKKRIPELKIDRAYFSFKSVKRLLFDGIWTSVNYLGENLNNGLDLIVSNLLLSPMAMGQLAIAKTMSTIFGSIFSIINPSFQPMMLKSYSEGDKKSLLTEMSFAMKVSGMLANIGFAGFFALGRAYYLLWIPNQDTELIYRLTVISLLTIIPGGPMQPLYYIYTLTVKKKFPCFVTILGGLLNVSAMYLLIMYTDAGIYAVVLTTVAVMGVINFITNPIYMAYVLNLPLYTFYPNIIRNLISCGTLTVCFKLMSKIYMPENWIILILSAFGYSIIGMCIHLLIVLSKEERERLRHFYNERTRL